MLKRMHQWTIEAIITEMAKMAEAMETATTAEATETMTTTEATETMTTAEATETAEAMDNISKVERRRSNLPSYVEPPSRIPQVCSLVRYSV